MTSDSQPPPRPRNDGPLPVGRSTLAALVVAVLLAASASGVALATDAASQSDAAEAPTVRISHSTVDPGETTTVRVVLTSAPDGVAGFELDLSVADGTPATITDAGYPDSFGLTTDPEIGEDGRSVRLEAADLEENVQPGASNVTLATVTVRGVEPGEATIDATVRQFDADTGDRVDPAVAPGAVVVGDQATADGNDDANTDGDDEPGAASGSEADAVQDSAAQPGEGGGLPFVADVPLLVGGILVGLLLVGVGFLLGRD